MRVLQLAFFISITGCIMLSSVFLRVDKENKRANKLAKTNQCYTFVIYLARKERLSHHDNTFVFIKNSYRNSSVHID